MTEEKYARPGMYLDTDDHGRLIAENRDAYERERRERLFREIEKIDVALDVVSTEEAQELVTRKEEIKDELREEPA